MEADDLLCSRNEPPNLAQASPLCDHPHAMAKTPTEQAYSAPLINKAAIMMFLLPRSR
jgi:hypothetical protein